MQALVVFRRALIVFFFCLLITPTFAQDDHRFNVSGGAGFTSPTSDASGSLDTGWNVDFRGGYNVTRNFLADLDFTYNHMDLNRTALAHFGQPGGYAEVWSITFTPIVRFAPAKEVDPYIIGGGGLYHRSLNLTRPATVQTVFCDFFFGFCFPTVVGTDVVVASFGTYKPGFNAGGGLEFRVGESGVKVFAEARYNEMFTNHGPNLRYVPVTFGVRW
jgi:hypothetical protein